MSKILGLLKLLPLKDYLYGAAILVLLIGFWRYTVHERAVGEAKVEAQDAELAAATKQHNLDAQALAAHGITQIGDTYVATVSTPVPDSPHVLVCKRAAPPTGGPVREAPGHPGVPDATPDVPEAAPVDIGPPVDTVGRNADALVTALQEVVRKLVDELNGKTR